MEQLEEVERAFVHVDYARRDGLEHKVERQLALATARGLSGGGGGSGTLPSGGGSGALLDRESSGSRGGHGRTSGEASRDSLREPLV